jgi:hypothetical protein
MQKNPQVLQFYCIISKILGCYPKKWGEKKFKSSMLFVEFEHKMK